MIYIIYEQSRIKHTCMHSIVIRIFFFHLNKQKKILEKPFTKSFIVRQMVWKLLSRQQSWITMINLFKISSVRLHYDHRILSGIQPTGSIHLGNYFGAIKQWIDLQQPQPLPSLIVQEKQTNDDSNEYKPKYLPPIFQIVDLHSLTMSNDPDKLRHNIFEITAVLIGCGIDPNCCLIFKQSSIPYHGYLCWILTTLTTLPQLHRFPQFKVSI